MVSHVVARTPKKFAESQWLAGINALIGASLPERFGCTHTSRLLYSYPCQPSPGENLEAIADVIEYGDAGSGPSVQIIMHFFHD